MLAGGLTPGLTSAYRLQPSGARLRDRRVSFVSTGLVGNCCGHADPADPAAGWFLGVPNRPDRAVKPIPLAANRFPRFYRGGSAIDELRGGAPGADGVFLPEDWVGSTTAAFGSVSEGLTRLEDGRTLREAIRSDPEGFLGRSHAEAYGDDPRPGHKSD